MCVKGNLYVINPHLYKCHKKLKCLVYVSKLVCKTQTISMNCIIIIIMSASFSTQKLYYKYRIHHIVDNSECQCKVKGTNPVKCNVTSSKQCRKMRSVEHKSNFVHNIVTLRHYIQVWHLNPISFIFSPNKQKHL